MQRADPSKYQSTKEVRLQKRSGYRAGERKVEGKLAGKDAVKPDLIANNIGGGFRKIATEEK